MTYASLLRPAVRRWAILYDSALIIGGSLFIALSARISIQLPFSPVPVTGQTLSVLLIGIGFGSKRGFLSVLAYLIGGTVGLPFFAGGTSGLARLFGPTGGYLFGFLVAAFVVGLLAERGWDKRGLTAASAMLLGNFIIYLFGLPYLALFVGTNRVFALGLYPFVPGDILKLVIASFLLPAGWRLSRYKRHYRDMSS